jgi:hypothetical protein
MTVTRVKKRQGDFIPLRCRRLRLADVAGKSTPQRNVVPSTNPTSAVEHQRRADPSSVAKHRRRAQPSSATELRRRANPSSAARHGRRPKPRPRPRQTYPMYTRTSIPWFPFLSGARLARQRKRELAEWLPGPPIASDSPSFPSLPCSEGKGRVAQLGTFSPQSAPMK